MKKSRVLQLMYMFSEARARSGRVLPIREEKIRKFVDRGEIEPCKKARSFCLKKKWWNFSNFFCIEIATEFSETWTLCVSGMVDEMCQFSAWSASIQGKNVQSVSDKICWCVALLALLRIEILYRLQRRPRGGIFGRAGNFLFSASLRVLFVSCVYS